MGKAFNQRQLPQNAANCEAIRKELDEFQKFVPLALALRSPAHARPPLGEDHTGDRAAFGDVAAENEEGDMECSFGKAGRDGHKNKEDEIDVQSLRRRRQGIRHRDRHREDGGEWEGIALDVKEYKETETYVVRVDETVTQMLDDHIVMAQAMSFSPFKAPFEARSRRGRSAEHDQRGAGRVARAATVVDVPRAHLRVGRHHGTAAARGESASARWTASGARRSWSPRRTPA